MSAFLSVELSTEFAAFCLTDFIDWRYIYSWFVFSTQLVNCCPPWMKELYLCTVAPPTVPSLWPPPPPPPPSWTKCTEYTGSVWVWGGGVGWGGVEMYCGPYSAGVLHSVSDRIQILKIASPPQTKMTSKDDIKGLVSLKFLRPCSFISKFLRRGFCPRFSSSSNLSFFNSQSPLSY